MTKNIYAHTASGADYPEYISVNETDDPDQFAITVRSKPTVRQGVYICGFARDKGKPGRCTPGDENCNNYCNSDLTRKIADSPLECEHTTEGETATISLTMQQMEDLAGAIIRANTGTSV